LKRIQISKKILDKEIFKTKAIQWAQGYDPVIVLESNHFSQKKDQAFKEFDCLIAVGSEHDLVGKKGQAFSGLKKFIDKEADYYFGYFSYDLKNEIEALNSNNPDQLGFPDLYFFQAQKILIWKNNEVQFHYPEYLSHEVEQDIEQIKGVETSASQTKFSDTQTKAKMSKEDYLKKAASIMNHIQRGDIYEVNFCQEFYQSPSMIDPLQVYHNLNRRSEAPFSSFLKTQGKFLMGASPERFVKKNGTTIVAQPIKGTAKRHSEPVEDDKIATFLSEDEKERAENIMIVDLIRNDLSKISTPGSVQVRELCEVYTFKQVHQLISTISCEAGPNVHPVDIIKNLFPMGSMTGAPKISAMKIIEEEEVSKRGLYSGSIGYFSPNQDFDFNVVIRSILYNQNRKYASMMVGSAITSQSDINKEYEECLLKARALKEALIGQI
jgi:para-aminobenzoate synthetase component 1